MPMKQPDQPENIDRKAELLARTARSLGLDIEEDQLSALAEQLNVIEALEGSALEDLQPILKMDADWHD